MKESDLVSFLDWAAKLKKFKTPNGITLYDVPLHHKYLTENELVAYWESNRKSMITQP